jgi:glutamate carboxypeptidase
MRCAEVFKKIDELEGEYLDMLEAVCNIESPTAYKAGVDAVGALFADAAKRLGWSVDVHEEAVAGNALCISFNEGAPLPPVTMSAHMDTVFPVGMFPTPAVRREGDRMYGPGTTDCKGGAVAAFFAMRALHECGFAQRPVRLVLQSDEETGSSISQKRTLEYMCKCGEGSVAFLNLEDNKPGTAVLKRKGILRYNIDVLGVAVHSSKCVDGASAIAEAAYKIIELEKFKDRDGLTVNCGVISGGTVANTVAEKCSFTVDIRFATFAQKKEAEDTVKHIVENCTVPGTRAEYSEVSNRPPMEYVERNVKLFERMNEIFVEEGLSQLVARDEPSGSDAAYTTAYGIPTVDSIGTSGGPIHSRYEYMDIPSLKESAKRLAAIVVCI